MKKNKISRLDKGKLVEITLCLTIEKENRYIIDLEDINRFFETFEKNLKKQNITLILEGERITRNNNYGQYITKFSEENGSIYFILLPWCSLEKLRQMIAPRIPMSYIKAFYQDNLYQTLPPRSEEDLEKLNQAYERFLDLIEKETQQEQETLKEKAKTLTHKINKIKQRRIGE